MANLALINLTFVNKKKKKKKYFFSFFFVFFLFLCGGGGGGGWIHSRILYIKTSPLMELANFDLYLSIEH